MHSPFLVLLSSSRGHPFGIAGAEEIAWDFGMENGTPLGGRKRISAKGATLLAIGIHKKREYGLQGPSGTVERPKRLEKRSYRRNQAYEHSSMILEVVECVSERVAKVLSFREEIDTRKQATSAGGTDEKNVGT